jgi:ubiquinone/menaquinone biosynthesis C-methylase UbiE
MSNKLSPGSPGWNDKMFQRHPTPYGGIAGWIERQRLSAIIRAITQRGVAKDATILEVGCEAGNLLKAVHQAFPAAQLIGMDISAAALDQAKAKLADAPVRFIQHDMTLPIMLNERPRVVICSETLEHVPDYKTAVAQLAKLGNTDTIFIITVPLERLKNTVKNALNRLGLFDLFFRGIEKGMSEWHINDFSKQDFLTLLEPYFEVKHYQQLLGLHQIAVCKRSNAQ